MADEKFMEITPNQEDVTDPAGGDNTPVQAVTDPEPTATPEDQALVELEEAPMEERPAKKAKLQERINEITRKRKEAESLAETKDKEAKELREKLAYEKARADLLADQHKNAIPDSVLTPDVQKPSEALQKPRREDFKDDDGYEDQYAYMEALAEFKARELLNKEQANREQQRKQQQEADNQKKGQEFLDAVNTEYPDFRDLVRYAPEPNPNLAAAIMAADNNKAVVYFLVKNTAEITRLNRMEPMKMAQEIGKLDARLSTPSAPVKTVSNAPAPITPVQTSGTGTPTEKWRLSMDDYMALRDREEFGERKT